MPTTARRRKLRRHPTATTRAQPALPARNTCPRRPPTGPRKPSPRRRRGRTSTATATVPRTTRTATRTPTRTATRTPTRTATRARTATSRTVVATGVRTTRTRTRTTTATTTATATATTTVLRTRTRTRAATRTRTKTRAELASSPRLGRACVGPPFADSLQMSKYGRILLGMAFGERGLVGGVEPVEHGRQRSGHPGHGGVLVVN